MTVATKEGDIVLAPFVILVIVIFFAMGLFGLIGQVAGALSDYRVAGSLGEEVERRVQHIVTTGAGTAAYAAVAGGVGVARAFSWVLR